MPRAPSLRAGTLISYSLFKNLEQLLPSVRRNLATLAADPMNIVVVCSGRERALMNEWLGDLPIWLVAENGLFCNRRGLLQQSIPRHTHNTRTACLHP